MKEELDRRGLKMTPRFSLGGQQAQRDYGLMQMVQIHRLIGHK